MGENIPNCNISMLPWCSCWCQAKPRSYAAANTDWQSSANVHFINKMLHPHNHKVGALINFLYHQMSNKCPKEDSTMDIL